MEANQEGYLCPCHRVAISQMGFHERQKKIEEASKMAGREQEEARATAVKQSKMPFSLGTESEG
jgi:hypothetical protein